VLTGEPIVGLDASTSHEVIGALCHYIDIMAENELIGETLYIEGLIAGLRADPVYRQSLLEKSVKEVDEKLQMITDELNSRIELYFFFLTSVGRREKNLSKMKQLRRLRIWIGGLTWLLQISTRNGNNQLRHRDTRDLPRDC
jgi:hypothetical protein